MAVSKLTIFMLINLFCCGICVNPEIEGEEQRAREYLKILNEKTTINLNRVMVAMWNYAANLTETNLQKKIAVEVDVAKEERELWKETIKFNWKSFSDYNLKRQYKDYAILGTAALPDDKHERLNKVISDMEKIYSTAKICDFNDTKKCDLGLEPELHEIFTNSRNSEELKNAWVEWRKAVGPKCKELYREYVILSNEAAVLNNFTDNGAFWLRDYEDPEIKQNIQLLWEQLKPFYLQIHAYIRHKLRIKYGDIVDEKGPIPAHLLGNMWSQTWSNVADFSLPYPGKVQENLTQELLNQNYTPTRIFQTAENFFKSINLTEMPKLFWERSILEKPSDRDVVCHASAWDMGDGEDFRIKQCTKVTLEHFKTAHHEMGHIEYFLQYKNQPVLFRKGANSGFHEAVGDLISLSVQSRKHLRKLGLLKSEDDPEASLNSLFQIALDKIVFLPYGYLLDMWRWEVFSGNTTPDNYNCKWWQLREEYQGIEPPIDRSEKDFDPSAKYHIVADVPYIRYFVSFVIQFQFHKAVCEKAGQYDPKDPSKPLHECDIYENTNAGNALKKMLELGVSKPWPEAMETLTGQRNMDASALLEYFKPLREWLETENKKNNAFIGWEKSRKVCVNSR